jgi:hypothetical protein
MKIAIPDHGWRVAEALAMKGWLETRWRLIFHIFAPWRKSGHRSALAAARLVRSLVIAPEAPKEYLRQATSPDLARWCGAPAGVR